MVREVQKPVYDMADLLGMDTLEQKKPVVAAGAGDLLDTLVQDHLERKVNPSAVEEATLSPEAAMDTAAHDADALADAVKLALAADGELRPESQGQEAPAGAVRLEGDGVDLLQKEIETLLRTAESGEGDRAGSTAVAVADAKNEADPEETSEVTTAERQVLVPENTSIATPVPMETPRTAEQAQLSDAENVLAAELAELAKETETKQAVPGAPDAAPMAAQADAPANATSAAEKPLAPATESAKDESELAASIQQIMASAVVKPPEKKKEPETADKAQEMSAGAGEPETSAPVVAPLTAAPEVAPAVKRTGVIGFIVKVFNTVLLLIAQVVDMPFVWVSELDKNVIGFIAFILLVSGAVLYVMSWYYH
jgi:hypothetical protein